ncbi:hypothetical protein K469DRAFT_706941 [Zopfia rhizophila CBS 207.26]|uniref:FHA domain-containing protein n=1 Tax=Zopfia rhizophila CBS 207.26 TaxID=1314779 RepID=A0A6A6E5K8_9PEZI|nr:hypothetical protein K469DRAFT_706941 [Zopfia rhizophila CBS 207.26]
MLPFDPTLEVTLRSIDGLDDFSERKILLGPNSTVPIGRSSKSAHKNLQAAPNNAFIDSPVISRDHAELSTNTSCGIPIVYIKDNGSMHGTTLNNVLLPRHRDHQLKNGDTLQFGVNVIRDQDSFIAKKYTFESKPAPARPNQSLPRAFSVPDAETSEEEDNDEDIEVLGSSPRVARYGSQSNPVNVDDFEDSQPFVIDVEEDTTMLPIEQGNTKGRGEPVENKAKGLTESEYDPDSFFDEDNSDHASEQSVAHGHDFPIVDSDDENSDGQEQPVELPQVVETKSSHGEMESNANSKIVELLNDREDSSEPEYPSEHDSEDDYDEVSSRGDEEWDDDDASVGGSPGDFDADRRLKLLEMINPERQKCLDGVSSLTPKRDALAPSQIIQSSATVIAPKENQSTNRSSATSMSLRNIMVNEKELTPSPHVGDLENSTDKPGDRVYNPANPTILSALKPNPPKDSESERLKNMDMDSSMFDVFGSTSWEPAPPVPPRPAAPKPMPWASAVPECGSFMMRDNHPHPWLEDPPMHNMFPLPGSDFRTDTFLSFSRVPMGAGMNSSSPTRPYNTYSDGPFRLPTTRANPAPEPAAPKLDAQQMNLGVGPSMCAPTPPTAAIDDWSSISPPQLSKDISKPRTKVSIPEIVEDAPLQPPTPTSVSSLKRKADVLDAEEATVSEVHSSNESTEQETTAVTEVAPTVTEPPRKRLRVGLQYAATAMAGVVVGGLGVLGALITLPESVFQ